MITVAEAEKIVLDEARPQPAVRRKLADAYGAVLRETICADQDQPSMDRSAMDGIAIAFERWEKGARSFPIAGIQKAGVAALRLKKKGDCLEIMTGAVLPGGCDCVVPVEQIQMVNRQAVLKDDIRLSRFQNIRRRAQDYRKGEVLIQAGSRLSPQQVQVAASVGKAVVKVSAPVQIAIIGTGDELVEIDRPVKPHQARRSNVYAIEAALRLNGFSQTRRFHFNDSRARLLRGLQNILEKFDVLILSGGVSMGKFDFVPEALAELGVKVLFHKVRQRPGKPFWFGQAKSGKVVFALPGNPVSTQVCAYRYVLPYLKKIMFGAPGEIYRVVLGGVVPSHPDLTAFLPVCVAENSKGERVATEVAFTGSGDYAALGGTAGFVELPAGRGMFRKGQSARFFPWVPS